MNSLDLPHDRPFSVREAVARGVSSDSLRTSRVHAPFPGVRSFGSTRRGADLPAPERRAAHLELCRAYAVRMPRHQFFSHLSAAQMLGAPLPSRLSWDLVHVAVQPPHREPRVAGVVGHRVSGLAAEPIEVDGLSVSAPATVWCQLGAALSVDELIAVGDHLVRERGASSRWGRRRTPALCSVDGLARALAASRQLGAPSLRAALPQIRVGSESPKETELRLALVRAGLPEPELNVELRDRWGRFVARLDLAYPAFRAAFEYDGRQHATDARQFARDVDRVHEITQLGWTHERFLSHHLDDGAEVAVTRIRSRLMQAGWRP